MKHYLFSYIIQSVSHPPSPKLSSKETFWKLGEYTTTKKAG